MNIVFFAIMALVPMAQTLPERAEKFNQRMEQQEAARLAALRNPQPEQSQRYRLGDVYDFEIKEIKKDGRLILGGRK